MGAPAWYPVAASSDAAPRHVFHGVLQGQELAVWRADDGHVNAWQNRCLHRGVRLSIGVNDGHELRCQYHGWRYANRTGGCTYVPAHPGDAPAPMLCMPTFPVAERHGLVWVTLDDAREGDGPRPVEVLEAGPCTTLRGVPFDAPADTVLGHLVAHRFQPAGALAEDDASMTAVVLGEAVALTSTSGASTDTVVFFVQPVDDGHCVVRGVLAGVLEAQHRIAVLTHHDRCLGDLREGVESRGGSVTPRDRAAVSPTRSRPPRRGGPDGRGPRTDVRVRRAWSAGEGVRALELAPLSGVLPTAQPGCHVDLHLPGGLVRQYSLTNGPGEQDAYRIAVKLEPQSRGGSEAVHGQLREGDVLQISGPHNRFVLRRDAFRTVLLAGGIGITPLLAMAQALDTSGPAYELHIFAQSAAHVVLADVVGRLRGAVHTHLGLDPEATVATIREALGRQTADDPEAQVYVCGPAPMIAAVRAVAAELGWPDDAVHFEYFANTNEVESASTFEVHLARSGTTFTVAAGRSLLDVLREHGVAVESSCEQGACGTCEVPVLDGEPEHQDVYLRESERARGDRMMACVSRARAGRLVLDL